MRAVFRRIWSFLRAPPRWFMVVLGALLLALLIWFVGPLVSIARWTPLAGRGVRLVLVALLALAVAGWYAAKWWRARRRNRAMVDALVRAPEGGADLAQADVEAMEARATAALQALRSARVGRDREYVYELPWYVIIGPPGSGKTTALKNSGLHFPIDSAAGEGPVKGLGGTRTTDWWITDRAVLIDTAGRYTTQDSEEAVDAKAWSGFLDVLKKHRPRQPVTGVIVAVSMTDLVGADEGAALAHGRAVRKRINEIQQAFGVRTPVYILLTKLDLLAGFVEFFDDLGAQEREQVWGETYPLAAGASEGGGEGAACSFDAAFDALTERLNARLLSRMQSEQDMARRGLIFGFPQQFATLKAPLAALIGVIAQETRFEPTPLIRGFYFASGVQLGRPVDRLLGAVAARFGLPPGGGVQGTARGRAYFLRDLLRSVIFPEAALAGRDPRAERRRRLVVLGVVGGGAALLALLTLVWTVGYVRSASLVHRLQARAEVLRRDAAALPGGEVSDSDLLQVLPVLNEARALPFASTAAPKDRSSGFTGGVGRDRSYRVQVDGAYHNLLNRQLLPRLILQLEDQLRAQLGTPLTDKGPDPRPATYNLLRTYLMLGRAPGAPLEKGGLRAFFSDDWADRFPGQEQEPVRTALERHLQSLLDGSVKPPPLDQDLISRARASVATLGPGERVYTRLTADPALRELPEFAVADAPGVAGSHLFIRRSGKSLATGVPGMFRRQAFFTAVLPAIARAASQSADEGWVMGQTARGAAPLTSESGRIQDALLVAYLRDFTTRWDDLIADLAVSPELPVALRIQAATRPPSPLKSLFAALAAETDLTPPNVSKGGVGAAARVGALFSRNIYRGVSRAGQVNSALNQGPPAPPGPLDDVIAHFRWLRELNPPSGPSPMDDAIAALAQVGDSSSAARAAGGLGDPLLQKQSAATAMAATAKLGQVTAVLPAGAGGLFTGFVKASTDQLNRDAVQSVRTEYGKQLLPECRAILAQGYPFQPGAEHQVSIDDFSRLLRPTGLMDSFQQQNLAGQIDTSGAAWTLTPSGRALGLQLGAVRQFQLADTIRRAFFKPGDLRPNVRFALEPLRIEGDAQAVTVTVDGQPAAFDRTAKKPVEMRWPGSQPGVTVGFQRAGSAAPALRTWTGDWALQKMLHDARISGVGPGGLVFQVSEGGASATFRLRLLNSTANPFTLGAVSRLQCPAGL